MERVIKFRAWYNNRMLYSHNNTINKSNVQNAWFFNKVNEDDIIMQFTGLTDKNGKEIYEGDILKVKSAASTPISIEHNGEQLTAYKPNYSNYFVVFYKGAFCIHNEPSTENHEKIGIYNGTTYGGTLQSANYDKEVIGNVHEHPHLIK